ncbi:MAG: hypothetical protein A2W35_06575 [Chloroflexi bacterium RBG_16_57_11]|nr:MAG: hypothetical protein A2W35_06575 [Chloroflexi bacterium RBG_16_57_11]HKZ02389.1 hypothetical protein [Pyrinomonadaceae bacterium]
MTELQAIRKRLADCTIPHGAVADWDGTEHWEIQQPALPVEDMHEADCMGDTDTETTDYWLVLSELLSPQSDLPKSDTPNGKRLGAVFDYAVAYQPDVGYLIEQLREVAISGVELDDERIRYVSIQIDREVWQTLQVLREEL